MRAYLEMTKPGITGLILLSTAAGFCFGRARLDCGLLLLTLLGVALLASGTAVLNEWCERGSDARMLRTCHRPLPSGRVTPVRALLFGVLLSAVAYAVLFRMVNPLAALCGLLTQTTYLFLYTPLKYRTPYASAVGAYSGAMPPIIGFAAAHASLTREAAALFLILYLWQFPHALLPGSTVKITLGPAFVFFP